MSVTFRVAPKVLILQLAKKKRANPRPRVTLALITSPHSRNYHSVRSCKSDDKDESHNVI